MFFHVVGYCLLLLDVVRTSWKSAFCSVAVTCSAESGRRLRLGLVKLVLKERCLFHPQLFHSGSSSCDGMLRVQRLNDNCHMLPPQKACVEPGWSLCGEPRWWNLCNASGKTEVLSWQK